jgi:hypothetical protein
MGQIMIDAYDYNVAQCRHLLASKRRAPEHNGATAANSLATFCVALLGYAVGQAAVDGWPGLAEQAALRAQVW